MLINRDTVNRSLVAAVLVTIFGTGLYYQSESQLPEHFRSQGSDWLNADDSIRPARMWQDPLRAAAGDKPDNIDLALKDIKTQSEGAQWRLMLVFVRGGSWPETYEERLRTRFAVNAAFASARFHSTNPGELKSFVLLGFVE